MRPIILSVAMLVLSTGSVSAEDENEVAEMGLAGLLSAPNHKDLKKLTLSAGAPLAAAPMRLKSGTYYTLKIEADGSQELALEGAGFFRAIWVNEIVIEGIEIRPLGVDSLEFDEAGEAEISFVAVRPGSYQVKVPGTSGDLQRLAVTIE